MPEKERGCGFTIFQMLQAGTHTHFSVYYQNEGRMSFENVPTTRLPVFHLHKILKIWIPRH